MAKNGKNDFVPERNGPFGEFVRDLGNGHYAIERALPGLDVGERARLLHAAREELWREDAMLAGLMAGSSFTVLLEPAEEGGYVVTCPALPGLVTEGDTWDEAQGMAADAVCAYIQSLRRDGLAIPPDKPVRLAKVPVPSPTS